MLKNSDYVFTVIKNLRDSEHSIQKILLQKAVYLFDFLREPVDLIFEAYTYGPFCRKIASILDEMEEEGIVEVTRREICIKNDYSEDFQLPPEDAERLKSY